MRSLERPGGCSMVIRHFSAFIAGVACLFASAAASAADAPFNWSGWYVVGTAGWGWRSINDYPPQSYYKSLGGNFGSGGGYGGSSGGGTPRYNGFVGAGGVGYNYQFSNLVIGAEYEFLYADLQTDPTSAKQSFTKSSGIYPTGYVVSNYDTVDGDSNRWYGIARLRAGIAVFDRLFVFASGGAAYRLSYQSQSPTITTIPYFTPRSTVTYNGYNTSHAWGWVAGAGAEYAFDTKFFLRTEWLHMDFGHAQYLDPIATALIGTPTVLQFRRTADLVRAGLVYRFYGGAAY